MDNRTAGDGWRSFTEEFEVASSELVRRIKDLIAEGRVRRLRLRSADGDIVLEIPLNIGAAAGGVVTLAAPWLALIAAFAALVARVRVEIVRDEPADKPPPETSTANPK